MLSLLDLTDVYMTIFVPTAQAGRIFVGAEARIILGAAIFDDVLGLISLAIVSGIVVSGTARVTCDDQVFLLSENQSTYIPIGENHRLENIGKIDLVMIEAQVGEYVGEDDIVRISDDFKRV